MNDIRTCLIRTGVSVVIARSTSGADGDTGGGAVAAAHRLGLPPTGPISLIVDAGKDEHI